MDSMLNFHLRTADWIVPAVDLRKLNETLYAVFIHPAASNETPPDLNGECQWTILIYSAAPNSFMSFPLGFTTLFSAVIKKTNKAHAKKYAEFDCKEKAIYEICGMTIDDIEFADVFELRCLKNLMGELKKILDEIQRMDLLNESALEEVHTKLLFFQQTNDVDDTEFQTWRQHNRARRSRYSERMDTVLKKIDEEYQEAEDNDKRSSLRVTKACQLHNLFYPDVAVQAIRDDRNNLLSQFLADDPLSASCPLIYALFRYTIDCRASRCARLLSLAPELGLTVNTDCLNHLVLNAANQKIYGRSSGCEEIDIRTEIEVFGILLSHLGTETNQAFVIEKMDTYLGNVLHYVTFYGLATLCRAIMKSLELVRTRGITARRAVLLKNFEGYTPLALAVYNNHNSVAKILVETLTDGPRASGDAGEQEISSYLGELLLVAIRSQFDDMVRLLLNHKASILSRTPQGYTPLYLAAQLNRPDYIKLFKSSFSFQYVLNAGEPLLNWTPLIAASVEGNTDVVDVLIEVGADPTLTDSRGWTASDYAAHKGNSVAAKNVGIDCTDKDIAKIAFSVENEGPSPDLSFDKGAGLSTKPCSVDLNKPSKSVGSSKYTK
ncbi:ribosomal protein P0 (A0) (L10E) [Ascosphaera pollenicola]|nr:ribosomal protein P0 (A0) (L10E) [Ascosphaera pollenicola]